MKRRIGTALSVVALVLMMSVGAPAAGRHPEIHRAIESLRNAKAHLEAAAHDYHGHRVDAIHAVDEAIHQLQICMEFD